MSFCGAALEGGDEVVQVYVYLVQGVSLQLGGGLRPLLIFWWLVPLLVGGLGGRLRLEGVRWGVVAVSHFLIRHVRYRLRGHAEEGGAVHVSHGKGQVKTH